jgi:hypothetical protein
MVFWSKKNKESDHSEYGATSSSGDVPSSMNIEHVEAQHKQEEELQQLQQQEQRKGCCGFNLDPDPSTLPMPELTPEQARIYKDLQRIQHVMDDAVRIPCINRSVGLDPLVGLLPFVGDFASAMVSCVLIARARKVGISGYTMTRMFINVCIDAAVGTIPLLGDVFDIGWQANSRNITIFENHMKLGAEKQRSIDKCFVCTLMLTLATVCLLTMLAFTAGFVLLILWVTGILGSS